MHAPVNPGMPSARWTGQQPQRCSLRVAAPNRGEGSKHLVVQTVADFGDKLGIDGAANQSLIESLLQMMAEQRADFTRVFAGLSDGTARDEFAEVFDRLGTRLSPALVDAFFAKYGEDNTGRMPVDVFVVASLESRNRIIAKEDDTPGKDLSTRA